MASFNNGRITASVTPPTNYTGNYTYELLKYNGSTYVRVDGTAEGYSSAFQNPVTVASESYTFGNTGGFEDNVEGSGSWVGLHPGTYKVVVTTSTGISCSVEDTIVVGQQDVVNPCDGFSISAAANGETSIIVTVTGGTAPFTWTLNDNSATPTDNGNGTFTFNGLTAGTTYAVEVLDANDCPANSTATTVALPTFDCTDANFQVANGTTGDPVSATVSEGTLVSVSPATYQEGSATYTATITIPAGYQNAGSNLTTCTDTATGTTVLPTFDCTDANFQVANGTTGDPVSATVDLGSIVPGSISPAQYTEGLATYTASILPPETGYANSGTSISCNDTATGTTTPVSNLIYYFHGFDDDAQEPWATESGSFAFTNFTDPTADYYLANTIGGDQSDFNPTPVNLDAVMSHLIDNGTVGNYSILNVDAGSGITLAGEPSATVLNFPAVTTGFNAQYYFAVPQSLTTTNYTNSGTCNLTNQSDGTSALPGQAADRKEFTYDGITYWLYRMSTPSQGQSYLGFNS